MTPGIVVADAIASPGSGISRNAWVTIPVLVLWMRTRFGPGVSDNSPTWLAKTGKAADMLPQLTLQSIAALFGASCAKVLSISASGRSER